jgi:peptidoglycan L-alanyl-D-glutamate endopeptidase CwlK
MQAYYAQRAAVYERVYHLPERQAELVAAGASRTLNSRHRTGHAVDLGAVVGNEVRWDWPLYFRLAAAVQAAAIELNTPIRWGGSWSLLNTKQTPERLQTAYIAARKAEKKRAFLDGPHFEIPR